MNSHHQKNFLKNSKEKLKGVKWIICKITWSKQS